MMMLLTKKQENKKIKRYTKCVNTFPHLSPPGFSLSTQRTRLSTLPAGKAQKTQGQEIQIKFALFLIYFRLKFFLSTLTFSVSFLHIPGAGGGEETISALLRHLNNR